jgi:hypothetical protein
MDHLQESSTRVAPEKAQLEGSRRYPRALTMLKRLAKKIITTYSFGASEKKKKRFTTWAPGSATQVGLHLEVGFHIAGLCTPNYHKNMKQLS